MPRGIHFAEPGGDVADDDVGVVGAGELQDVELGDGLVLEDPVAFGFDAGGAPEIVGQLAAADALEVHEAGLGRCDLRKAAAPFVMPRIPAGSLMGPTMDSSLRVQGRMLMP